MQIDDSHIRKLAHLARLELADAEVAQLKHDLSCILSWVEKLREVDTDGIEPLISPVEQTSVMRPDEPGSHLPREKVLRNAPLTEEPFILVPKVIT
ncbi:MAG: Asp-tRNA(Asn)/Glu-tRNA(Gln) amidotransferase subunit GatC [Cyclobacteriaceae bacterium]|nr:Asp-tRNA(Asn)/Glu-tRNA(Gln) amidotransferase subunit GatC [Cyclobacteriaceae bacterium]MCX7638588.1 Asp-tRNA(Asn)/Glu-tRNA(Gln) amidotransferase subunit GatC [Cyclobacteriaceae bacterium]MDW8332395.1 Asp-tRNA(Asn)/Glu-tRNA(Gln) amidotransferase subunit GatC [Cyclobacteriaceae bacterium]